MWITQYERANVWIYSVNISPLFFTVLDCCHLFPPSLYDIPWTGVLCFTVCYFNIPNNHLVCMWTSFIPFRAKEKDFVSNRFPRLLSDGSCFSPSWLLSRNHVDIKSYFRHILFTDCDIKPIFAYLLFFFVIIIIFVREIVCLFNSLNKKSFNPKNWNVLFSLKQNKRIRREMTRELYIYFHVVTRPHNNLKGQGRKKKE